MTGTATAVRAVTARRFRLPDPSEWRSGWARWWSVGAAYRAVRAAVVMPGLFALSYQVIGNSQVATFAAFGGFSTLVLAGFGGTRRDQLVAHLGLAVTGSALLTIGTAVNSSTALAAVVTLAVAFAVLFFGVIGPNAASGATAALLTYVLPAASPGTVSMVPDRLAGWWLASVGGTLAVVLFSPKPPADRLRAGISGLAVALADELDAAAGGTPDPARREVTLTAKAALRSTFTATPYRPTGLATPDQAMNNVVELLDWVVALVGDTVGHVSALAAMEPGDRELLRRAAETLRAAGHLAVHGDGEVDLASLEQLRTNRVAAIRHLAPDSPEFEDVVHGAFHARTVAIAVRTTAADTLVAARRAAPEVVEEQRLRWLGIEAGAGADAPGLDRWGGARSAARLVGRHASLRSVWLRNSARGALALAAAVAVADLTNVQHGFWVVLGTLSVLRSNATATGATALRAVLGTTIGFVIGAALVVGVGTDTNVLWALLPVAVLIASYTPGVTSFVTGQAAFTVVVSILYNLLVPVGWKVGVTRIEDVAVGCAVSLVVGLLLWPRGASAVVATDLHDAFTAGAGYLDEAVGWAVGTRPGPPEGGVEAVDAAVRLDDALRGYLTEQGSKRTSKDDLWNLVGAAMRLRLTAASLAGLAPTPLMTPTGRRLDGEAAALTGWYRTL
ncbi:MAG TPA: FUSC family protein, partial [Acidimicrobiales bacterium]